MSFDTFALAAMASELRSIVLEGRVQRVVQINSLTYGFEIYVHPIRHYLILSVEPQAPRLHLTEKKVRRGTGNDTPLMLVLRKYMRGAILKAIEQPPYERILNFHFDNFHTGPTLLAAEMLGPRSNLILVAPDQTILGVARLPKAGQTRQRTLLPNQVYDPPPAQNKLTPAELTEFNFRQELAEASPNLELARLLPNILVGISPLLAREIIYRATGDTNTTVGQLTALTPILTAIHDLFNQLTYEAWQPTLAFDEEGFVEAFAAYPLHHLPQTETGRSMSAVVESYFAKAAAGYAAAKTPLVEAIAAARQKLVRRRERLEEDAAAQADPTLLKDKGEAILAHAYQLQAGQESLTVDWPGRDTPLKIALEASLSASANAQNYFNRYRKAQRASEEIPNQLKKISLEDQYLEQLEQDLDMADDRPEIDAVALALSEAGYYRARASRKKQQKRAATRYLRLTAPDGATVWAGKNALQNAYLTFTRASADDLWLHARDVPGAHVIIPTTEGLPSEADVFWAASVAAYYSRARHDTSVEVDVTVKKYVRAIKGATPGLVTYRNETTLRVVPEEPEED
ncbi:MAG: NFACT family protein [Anaerolineales bacterium]|nr:NFACT family protein [Anaerolineales bacterium]